MVSPLKRETLADQLLTQLRQQVLSGRLKPGAPLPAERELQEAFGVGRTTVREALQGLVATGFVTRRGGQLIIGDPMLLPDHAVDYAALAARLSVEEVFTTRRALESTAVELAARNWTDDDLDELKQALDAMRDPVADEAYHTADVEFHTTIVRIGKNRVLSSVYDSSKHLFFRLPSFWRLFGAKAERSESSRISGWDGHNAVYEAIARRDAEAAVRQNTEMLDRVERVLIQRLQMAQAEHADATETTGPDEPTTTR